MKKQFMPILFLLVLAVALSGCSGDKEESSSSSITIGIAQDLEDSLDPHQAVAAGTKEILFNVFEGLIKPDNEGNLQPAVASNYKVSEDGKVYSFILRDGIRFHDGTLVTIEDVKYSIEKCADFVNGNPLQSAFLNVKEVSVTGENSIDIILKDSDFNFLTYLSGVNAAIIPKNNENPETNPIGTGPYRYVSRAIQENIILERFTDYWGESAYIEEIKLKVCANADTIVLDLMGGAIDMFCRVTPAQADQISRDDFAILEGTMNLVQAMYLNHNEKPFDDVRVRQALCYAVNPEDIMLYVSDGKGTEIGSSMFPAFEKYYRKELNDVYDQDIEKAKELLAEAGYPDGFSFTLTVPSNYQQHVDTAQVLVEELKQVNVTANIELIEWDSWLSDVYTDRNFQATVVGVDASVLTPEALLSRFLSDASNNFTNYRNKEYDESYAKMSDSDDTVRTEAVWECEEILARDAANVYIQDLPELVVLNNKYTGYVFYPLYVQDFSKLKVAE